MKSVIKVFLFLVTNGVVYCDESNQNYFVVEVPPDSRARQPFTVYWNVPTSQCRSKKIPFDNLGERFGIIQNANDSFRGEKVAILYDPGCFPAILTKDGGGGGNEVYFRNGGVPQEGDLKKHLQTFTSDVEKLIPDANFSGIGIIDFESWRPIFRQNFGVVNPYKNLSIEIERQRHPWWFTSKVKAEARRRFEASAKEFMLSSLRAARRLRPAARWGYYGYPYCFNVPPGGQFTRCSREAGDENDRISWLWQESDALYPSVYSLRSYDTEQLSALVKTRVTEAARAAAGRPVLPYFWYRHRDGDFLSEKDVKAVLSTLYRSNASGVIVWGSSQDVRTVAQCERLHEYIYNIFGPIIAKYTRTQPKVHLDNSTEYDGVTEETTEQSHIVYVESPSAVNETFAYNADELDNDVYNDTDYNDNGANDSLTMFDIAFENITNAEFDNVSNANESKLVVVKNNEDVDEKEFVIIDEQVERFLKAIIWQLHHPSANHPKAEDENKNKTQIQNLINKYITHKTIKAASSPGSSHFNENQTQSIFYKIHKKITNKLKNMSTTENIRDTTTQPKIKIREVTESQSTITTVPYENFHSEYATTENENSIKSTEPYVYTEDATKSQLKLTTDTYPNYSSNYATFSIDDFTETPSMADEIIRYNLEELDSDVNNYTDFNDNDESLSIFDRIYDNTSHNGSDPVSNDNSSNLESDETDEVDNEFVIIDEQVERVLKELTAQFQPLSAFFTDVETQENKNKTHIQKIWRNSIFNKSTNAAVNGSYPKNIIHKIHEKISSLASNNSNYGYITPTTEFVSKETQSDIYANINESAESQSQITTDVFESSNSEYATSVTESRVTSTEPYNIFKQATKSQTKITTVAYPDFTSYFATFPIPNYEETLPNGSKDETNRSQNNDDFEKIIPIKNNVNSSNYNVTTITNIEYNETQLPTEYPDMLGHNKSSEKLTDHIILLPNTGVRDKTTSQAAVNKAQHFKVMASGMKHSESDNIINDVYIAHNRKKSINVKDESEEELTDHIMMSQSDVDDDFTLPYFSNSKPHDASFNLEEENFAPIFESRSDLNDYMTTSENININGGLEYFSPEIGSHFRYTNDDHIEDKSIEYHSTTEAMTTEKIVLVTKKRNNGRLANKKPSKNEDEPTTSPYVNNNGISSESKPERSRHLFCFIFYFYSVSKCICDLYNEC